MLSKEEIAKAYEALSRLVESQYSVAYPFHNPVSSDAELAIREIKSHIAYLEERAATMSRICAGMTLEEMQNAAFTYQSLVEIVQRRDVRNVCVPDLCEMPDDLDWDRAPDAFTAGQVTGWNECCEEMISKMGEQK